MRMAARVHTLGLPCPAECTAGSPTFPGCALTSLPPLGVSAQRHTAPPRLWGPAFPLGLERTPRETGGWKGQGRLCAPRPEPRAPRAQSQGPLEGACSPRCGEATGSRGTGAREQGEVFQPSRQQVPSGRVTDSEPVEQVAVYGGSQGQSVAMGCVPLAVRGSLFWTEVHLGSHEPQRLPQLMPAVSPCGCVGEGQSSARDVWAWGLLWGHLGWRRTQSPVALPSTALCHPTGSLSCHVHNGAQALLSRRASECGLESLGSVTHPRGEGGVWLGAGGQHQGYDSPRLHGGAYLLHLCVPMVTAFM